MYLYVEAHMFILETQATLGICYRMMLVLLLLFMHLLVVDQIIVIIFCTWFQGVKRIDYKDFRTNVRASEQNRRVGNILPQLKIHWLKIQNKIKYKILILTYKSYYNTAPSYLCELINPPPKKNVNNTILLVWQSLTKLRSICSHRNTRTC